MKSPSPDGRSVLAYIPAALLLILTWLMFAAPSLAQQIRLEGWTTYTSMVNCRVADSGTDGIIWAGTSGGVFAFDPQTESYLEFRNIDALEGLDITALRINPSTGFVYVGTFDGFISVYDGERWTNIRDINDKSDQFPSLRVNDFAFLGNNVFVAGDFGLALVDAETNLFQGDAQNFGGLQDISLLRLIIADDRLWAATNEGVVTARLTDNFFNFPRNPDNWITYPLSPQSTDRAADDIIAFQGDIYTINRDIVFRFTESGFINADSVGKELIALASDGNNLVVATKDDIREFKGSVLLGVPSDAARFTNINFVDYKGVNSLAVSTQAKGILVLANLRDVLDVVAPNSPAGNLFSAMSVAPDGTLWCGSSRSAGTGIYALRDEQWFNFTKFTHPDLATNDYHSVFASTDGAVYTGSWGRGYSRFTTQNDEFEFTHFYLENSPLVTFAPGDPSFVLVGEFTEDERRGLLWILNTNNTELLAYDKEGAFHTFRNTLGIRLSLNSITVDASGTKWIAGEQGNNDLIYFNERFTIDDESDDIWGNLNTSNSALTENEHNAVAVDLSDQVWVGSPKNLFVIANPYAVLTNSRLFIRAVSAMAGQLVNDIAVDPLNNKWVATNTGVWVLNEDGTEVLAQITSDNSPLLSDVVSSLAIDANSGRIYIGSNAGLLAVQTLSIRSNSDFADMRCYPQPFSPSRDDEMVIDGLGTASIVKVATLDGLLVREIDALNSRTVIWDGRNDKGDVVSSGVYLISAFSDPLSESAVIKAVVIRRD